MKPILPTKCKIVIGLDCGRNTGVAIYSLESKRFIQLITFEPHSFIIALTSNSFFASRPKHELTFVAENANFNKLVFPQKLANPAITRLKGMAKLSACAKIGLNVGRNLEATYVTINFLMEKGYNVQQIKPTTKKWDAEIIQQKFPYLTTSNEHTRDAVKLVTQYLNLDSDLLLF